MTNEHPDDEAISAHLDGEATPDEDAHISGCAVCGRRLTSFRAAASVVATPVPPPADGERDDAIAAALRAAPDGATVTALRPRALPRWLPAAAAVLAVVGLVSLVAGLGGGDDDTMTAAGGDDADELSQTSGDDAGIAAMEGAAVTVDGGDVGAVTARELRDLVEAALADDGDAAGRSASPGPAAAGTESAADAQAAAPCEDRARSDFDDLGALRYRAMGTIDGTDVSILAFDLIADSPRLRVLALTLDGCVISVAQEIAVEP